MDMGRREERMRCMERVTWKLTFPYVKQRANRNLLYGSGNSNRGSVSTLRGGMRKEIGGSFNREQIYVYLWLLPFQSQRKAIPKNAQTTPQLHSSHMPVK